MPYPSAEPLWKDDAAAPADSGLIDLLRRLQRAYQRGDFGPTVHETHPGLDVASREHYLYFTLAPALNFQRRSEALWRAADTTFRDQQTRFVFFPEHVSAGRDAYLTALSRHGLASFRDKHTDIWVTISTTLATNHDADPRHLLAAQDFDVTRIKGYITSRRRDFPYLSGPKLLNYWLYMLDCFTDAVLLNKHEISIIPDVHVIAASVHLGVVADHVRDRDAVAAAWSALLAGSELTPVEMHGPLWRWARSGFPQVLD